MRLFAPAILATMLLAACGGDDARSLPPAATAGATMQGNVTVFAAASLTDAFNQIKRDIEAANPGAKATMNYAGSPTLRIQLLQGGRADVFASADLANMQGAISDGRIDGQPATFAHNRLVVVTPADDAKVGTLDDLARPGVKLVLELPAVPAGAYARQAFGKMGHDPAFGADFASKTLANIVSEEPDVKSVLARIQLGEADAGVLYVSDVNTPAVRDRVRTIDIPDQFNVIADYPIALTRGAPNPAAGRAFIQYVLSPAGQAALQQNGLLPARP